MCVHLMVPKETGRKAGGKGGVEWGRDGTAWQMLLHQAVVQVHSENWCFSCWALRVPPSALGCAGLGWHDLGCKDQGMPCSHSLGVECWPQHPGPAGDVESCCEILLQTKGLAPYLTHHVQTHCLASGTSLIILEMWGWNYCNSCRVSFLNSFLKSITETETRLRKFRGNLNRGLSTRLFPKVSAGSLGRNGTSFLLSKHRPVVCCCYARHGETCSARSAGDAENQISMRSPVLSVRADCASCVLAAVLQLLVQPRLQDLAFSRRDPSMPALRKIAQQQACNRPSQGN